MQTPLSALLITALLWGGGSVLTNTIATVQPSATPVDDLAHRGSGRRDNPQDNQARTQVSASIALTPEFSYRGSGRRDHPTNG